jgi:integrase
MRLPKYKGFLKSKTETKGEKPEANSNQNRLVFLKISFNYAREFISLNLSCLESDWDTKAGRCHTKPNRSKGYTVSKIAGIINNEIERHIKVADSFVADAVNKLDRGDSQTLDLTAEDLKESILTSLGKKKPNVSNGKHSFFAFADSEAILKERTKDGTNGYKSGIGTARRYRSAAKIFRDFLGKDRSGKPKDIAFEDITPALIRDFYKSRMEKVESTGDEKPGPKKKEKKPVMQSTAYVSIRILKTLYRRGIRRLELGIPDIFLKIESEEIEDADAKAKDKLTDSDIEAIRTVELTGRLAMSRDLFLFCYYNAGTRVRDAILLEWVDVFQESKTGKAHAIFPKAKAIIEKYKGKGKYVFGYLSDTLDTSKDLYNAASSATTLINRDLKEIAKLAGLSEHWQKSLSSHIARHTAIMKIVTESGDIFITSRAVGHANPQQTSEYLRTHSPSLIDNRISEIMDKL